MASALPSPRPPSKPPGMSQMAGVRQPVVGFANPIYTTAVVLPVHRCFPNWGFHLKEWYFQPSPQSWQITRPSRAFSQRARCPPRAVPLELLRQPLLHRCRFSRRLAARFAFACQRRLKKAHIHAPRTVGTDDELPRLVRLNSMWSSHLQLTPDVARIAPIFIFDEPPPSLFHRAESNEAE